MVPPSAWPKRSTTSTSPGWSMSIATWLFIREAPAALALALISALEVRPQRHELHREGAAGQLLARDAAPGTRRRTDCGSPARAGPPTPPRRTDPRARSISASGIFGRPSLNRSNGFCAVGSTICSLVSVNSCASETTGINSVATEMLAARSAGCLMSDSILSLCRTSSSMRRSARSIRQVELPRPYEVSAACSIARA